MDPAAPQPLPAGWQPNLQRMLSDIVPMLSAELRHAFRDFVKGLTAKRDALEIPSLSAALMEQAPQVVGADLWQQCIDRRERAEQRCARTAFRSASGRAGGGRAAGRGGRAGASPARS